MRSLWKLSYFYVCAAWAVPPPPTAQLCMYIITTRMGRVKAADRYEVAIHIHQAWSITLLQAQSSVCLFKSRSQGSSMAHSHFKLKLDILSKSRFNPKCSLLRWSVASEKKSKITTRTAPVKTVALIRPGKMAFSLLQLKNDYSNHCHYIQWLCSDWSFQII